MHRPLAALTLLMVSAAATAAPYKSERIRHTHTRTAWEGTVDLGNLEVELTINYEVTADREPEAAYPVDYILANLELSNLAHRKLMLEHHRPPYDCRGSYSADLFILSYGTLKDESIWEDWFARKGERSIPIAFYDTTPEVPGHNNILFAPHDPAGDFESLQHEFSHYFWNRYCLEDIRADSEALAQEMERRTAHLADRGRVTFPRPGRQGQPDPDSDRGPQIAIATVTVEPVFVEAAEPIGRIEIVADEPVGRIVIQDTPSEVIVIER